MATRKAHNPYEFFFGSKIADQDYTLHWTNGTPFEIKKGEPTYLPKQIEAYHAARNPKTEILFMGGALGGSKSYGGRAIVAMRLIELGAMRGLGMVSPDPIVGAIFRENYPQIANTHLDKVQSWPSWLGKYYKSEKVFRFKEYKRADGSIGGGSILKFLNLDKAEKYASSEFAIVFIDESTFNSEAVFNVVQSRVRWAGLNCVTMAASNPGRAGHSYHKKRFVDPKTREDGVVFIPSLLSDNPFLNADPKYRKILERYPPKIKKAWLEGSWDQFEGQYFPDLNPDIHLIPANFPIPTEWMRIRIIDWGFRHPAACLWLAFDPEGNIYCYRTYEAIETAAKLVKEHIHKLSVDPRTGKPEKFAMTIADPSLKGVDGSSGNKTPYEVFNDQHDEIGSFFLVDAMRERIEGWQALQQAFYYEIDSDASEEKGGTVFKIYPQIKILDAPTHTSYLGQQSIHGSNALWDELNGLVYDDKKIEDAMKRTDAYDVGEGDDLAECLRYGWAMAGKTDLSKMQKFERNTDWGRNTGQQLTSNLTDDIKLRIARGTFF
jgi:phage terminase large subunit